MAGFANVFCIAPFADNGVDDVTAGACEVFLDVKFTLDNVTDWVMRTCGQVIDQDQRQALVINWDMREKESLALCYGLEYPRGYHPTYMPVRIFKRRRC